jgi:hypothetical protein
VLIHTVLVQTGLTDTLLRVPPVQVFLVAITLLVGVSTGPLLTRCASLPTLLWRDRGRAAGVEVG